MASACGVITGWLPVAFSVLSLMALDSFLGLSVESELQFTRAPRSGCFAQRVRVRAVPDRWRAVRSSGRRIALPDRPPARTRAGTVGRRCRDAGIAGPCPLVAAPE